MDAEDVSSLSETSFLIRSSSILSIHVGDGCPRRGVCPAPLKGSSEEFRFSEINRIILLEVNVRYNPTRTDNSDCNMTLIYF